MALRDLQRLLPDAIRETVASGKTRGCVTLLKRSRAERAFGSVTRLGKDWLDFRTDARNLPREYAAEAERLLRRRLVESVRDTPIWRRMGVRLCEPGLCEVWRSRTYLEAKFAIIGDEEEESMTKAASRAGENE